MALTAAEQYLLELINRARMDPAGEAALYGRDLNDGLNPGTISTEAKQVLAHNDLLERAAIDHSQWMLEADVFSHTGEGGSNWGSRMQEAGYSGGGYRENLAWRGSTFSVNALDMIDKHHEQLYDSAAHRKTIFSEESREIGIAQELGDFTTSRTYKASMLTNKYAYSGDTFFVTGVAYRDSDGDDFYTAGEGQGGIGFRVGASNDATAGAGGYAVATGQSKDTVVTISQGGTDIAKVWVDTSGGNAKVDLVTDANGGRSLNVSVDARLAWGVSDGKLLGSADLELRGWADDNTLEGNHGDNFLSGGGGDDTLRGQDGTDRLKGGGGNDRLEGGQGRDKLQGSAGNDDLRGGQGRDKLAGDDGADRLDGGVDNDRLTGGRGTDTFVFTDGRDAVTDFENDVDTLVFDRQALGLAADFGVDDLLDMASVRKSKIFFAFSAEDRLTLRDYTDLDSLADDLALV